MLQAFSLTGLPDYSTVNCHCKRTFVRVNAPWTEKLSVYYDKLRSRRHFYHENMFFWIGIMRLVWQKRQYITKASRSSRFSDRLNARRIWTQNWELGALPQTPKFSRHFEYRESQRKSQMSLWLSRLFTSSIPPQDVLPQSLILLLWGICSITHPWLLSSSLWKKGYSCQT